MSRNARAELSIRAGDILLGKYRVEHFLGQGGMGAVIAARHMHLGELFAIKVLLPSALEEENALARFLREARAAARLKGEHVAKVIDVGQFENGMPFMVMEYLEGSDLRSLIDKCIQRTGTPPPVEDAVLYMMHACEALVEAHEAGIIHRDIKPSNLFLIRRASGVPCIKVLDFGISKQVQPDEVELTRTGSMFGSPLYMSPEQMAQSKDVDVRTDIWSVGTVFYELLTGSPPFPGSVVTEVVAKVLQNEALPPSRIRSGVPVAVDEIVMRCLRKRPQERFQSMGELLEALRELLSEEWVRASALGKVEGASGLLDMARASMPSIGSVPMISMPTVEPALTGSGAPSPVSTVRGAIGVFPSTEAPWGKTAPGPPANRSVWLPFAVALLGSVVVGTGLWLGLGVAPENNAMIGTFGKISANSATPSSVDRGREELPVPTVDLASAPEAAVDESSLDGGVADAAIAPRTSAPVQRVKPAARSPASQKGKDQPSEFKVLPKKKELTIE